MGYTTFGGDPLPEMGEGAVVPAHLSAALNSMDPRTNHVAIDAADRDAKYAGLKAGSVVVCPAGRCAWLKLTDSAVALSWDLIYLRGDWVTLPGSIAASGFSVNLVRVKPMNEGVFLEGYMNRTGADLTAGATGGLTDTPVLTLPDPWKPNHKVTLVGRTSATGGELDIQTTGVMELVSMHSTGVFASGTNITFSGFYARNI